jgi:hypothetical protein
VLFPTLPTNTQAFFPTPNVPSLRSFSSIFFHILSVFVLLMYYVLPLPFCSHFLLCQFLLLLSLIFYLGLHLVKLYVYDRYFSSYLRRPAHALPNSWSLVTKSPLQDHSLVDFLPFWLLFCDKKGPFSDSQKLWPGLVKRSHLMRQEGCSRQECRHWALPAVRGPMSKAVNREDKLSRRYRDRDIAKFERSRRYRQR